jgi:hypothetical protein
VRAEEKSEKNRGFLLTVFAAILQNVRVCGRARRETGDPVPSTTSPDPVAGAPQGSGV